MKLSWRRFRQTGWVQTGWTQSKVWDVVIDQLCIPSGIVRALTYAAMLQRVGSSG